MTLSVAVGAVQVTATLVSPAVATGIVISVGQPVTTGGVVSVTAEWREILWVKGLGPIHFS